MKQGAPFRVVANGVLLSIRLTPRASRDGIDGLKQGQDGLHVQARVRAVPEDGKANAALVELVAAEIGVPKSTVTVAAGQTARLKTLLIAGDPKAVEQRVRAWAERLK